MQFSKKPPPFVLQLAIGDENALWGPNRAELGAIKCVAAGTCLYVDEREIAVDRGAR
jgi:hypothetical protein